ncbi:MULTISPECIES: ABC transporter substrate-binding protein [Pseudomonas]|jgi:peptide/nickel transport system substrate-binding protein|uniref:ABC transporter substrate-binding protein n=1 Tax=Pseudomonas TaxID=286 RepID=UPI0006D42A13|nr:MULTISPECIES: ABC transporter substrate-binding protein [Pseudomonas]MCP8347759.1 ABC transporter substrate-binding protein [Pseudomonas sp. FBF18]MCQ0167448.1 ABC transporter substrate-binding protein [Pseudomonas sp. S12(2018)]MDD1953522.1 ABC transporter substrate-binding protein [Pseudomonas sp. 8209]
MNPNHYSRRQFIGQGLAMGGGLLLGTSLLSGCGPDDAPAPAAGVAQPRHGGRLRLGILDGGQTGNLDAHKPIGSGIVRGFALYSKLWEWDEQMQPRLALAEFAEASSDARSWTLRLRQGLEFHNAKTIDADDLIFSIRRLTDPQLASPYAALLHWVDRDNLVKLDNRTVRLSFKDGRSFLPLPETWVNFGGIVPVDYHPVTNPVGAGPYRFKSFTPGQRSVFSRFENYYKAGRPYADELEIIDFKDQVSRLAALRAGQIDMANGMPSEQLQVLERDPRLNLVTSISGNWLSFEMNTSKPPFNDPRVREALRLLADRDELVRRALNGQGRVANDLYAPFDPTFNHALPPRAHDPQRAAQLLREAGQEHLRVELVTTAGPALASALVLAEQARRIGVTLDVRQVDSATFNGPQQDQWLLSTGGTIGAPFLASAMHTDAPFAVANKTHFDDPQFTQLFLQAMAQPDLARRTALVHQAQQIQYDKGGLLIWGYANLLDAFSRKVGGAAPEQTLFSTWRFENLWLNNAA